MPFSASRGAYSSGTESQKSRRSIHLPQFAVDALIRHRRNQNQKRLLAGGRRQKMGLVFTSTIGTPLTSGIAAGIVNLLKAAKLPVIRIHDLRHTCASLLLAQGVHPRIVQEVLGHSQVSITLDTYSHLIPGLGEAAAEQMNAVCQTPKKYGEGKREGQTDQKVVSRTGIEPPVISGATAQNR